jgi:hypothetical protein
VSATITIDRRYVAPLRALLEARHDRIERDAVRAREGGADSQLDAADLHAGAALTLSCLVVPADGELPAEGPVHVAVEDLGLALVCLDDEIRRALDSAQAEDLERATAGVAVLSQLARLDRPEAG